MIDPATGATLAASMAIAASRGATVAPTGNRGPIPFTRIATVAWMLLALLGCSALSSADTVRLYFDPATPQIAAWHRYTDLMDALYVGVDMQRSRSFTDWHAYDRVVLQNYLDLGGVGEPDWQEQK